MRYSIITPTLVRPSLRKLCDSITAQTNGDWEHIVMVDVPLIVNPAKRAIVESIAKDPRRKFFRCGKAHKNYGNTCRWNAWEKASGDYILYLDDDDFYADDKVFETLEQVRAPWAVFTTLRRGEIYCADPPSIHKTGSNMFMYRRDTGVRYHDPDAANYSELYPKGCPTEKAWAQLVEIYAGESGGLTANDKRYAADGLTVEELKSKYPYQIVHSRPLTIYERDNRGRE